jgi:hypothetical protein
MPSISSKFILATALAAFFALGTAATTAEAGHGGGHFGGGHFSGGHFSGGHIGGFKGGGVHMGNAGRFHGYGGGARAFRYGGGSFKGGNRYAYGGWSGGHGHYNHYYHNHFRPYGYWWWGAPYATYSYSYGGCGWLYRRAAATGSAYWWNRYETCVGGYY